MIRVVAVTDIGNIRKKNQDGFYVDGLSRVSKEHERIYYESSSDSLTAFVADGVGSTSDAEFAVAELNRFFSSNADQIKPTNIELNLVTANVEIIKQAALQNKSCASTVAGIICDDQNLIAFNIGDSKIFVLNNGFLEQISTDDTAEALMNASEFEFGNLVNDEKMPLLQTIGTGSGNLDVHISNHTEKKDILICSDGLTDMVTLDDMESIVQTDKTINEKVDELLCTALKNGGDDNITIVYVQFR